MKNKVNQRPAVNKGTSSKTNSPKAIPSTTANKSDSRDDEIFAEPHSSSVQNVKNQRVQSVRPTLSAQAILIPRGSR